MTEKTSTDQSNRKDREAQFLASQKARLSKLHDVQSKEHDADAQTQRKEFWKVFKQECKALNDRLVLLVEQDERDESAAEAGKDKILFVTSQQRNEALEKLQGIQRSILAVNHYTLRSTKLSTDEVEFLPEYFAQNEMPELPQADLRLLNIEIHSLKSRTKDTQQIIIPKEKFRFKRYHALMLEKNNLRVPIFEEDEMPIESKEEDDEEKNDSANDNRDQLAFDGLTLSGKKDCVVVVLEDGTIVLKNLQHEIIDRIVPTNILLAAKAFLIRDVTNCQVQVHGLYNSVHMINTIDTMIQIVAPVHGPVHVTKCKNSTIQIPFSRQLRIHDCLKVTFVIHVASGPIIEGCNGMHFVQSDYILPKMKQKGSADDFDPGANHYWDVKDFHWLKNNVKSPNFEVCKQEESEKYESIRALLKKFAGTLRLDQPTDYINKSSPITSTSIEAAGAESDDEDSSEDEL